MNIRRVWSTKTASVTRCFICCALCAACSAGPNEPLSPDEPTSFERTDFEVVATPQRKGEAMTQHKKPRVGQLDARMQGYVAGASKDLAAKLQVSADQIELVEARYVTWRDSSLGCPKPDTQYMQTLVNGTRIKLRSAGKIYHYHGGRNKPPTLCEKPASSEPLPYGSGDA